MIGLRFDADLGEWGEGMHEERFLGSPGKEGADVEFVVGEVLELGSGYDDVVGLLGRPWAFTTCGEFSDKSLGVVTTHSKRDDGGAVSENSRD